MAQEKIVLKILKNVLQLEELLIKLAPYRAGF